MKSVLSIQSAVTFGAVGNTMANLVMTACGHHLCCVDTVQLAAHPGHGFRAGGSIDDHDFIDLLAGLEKLDGVMSADALMTGYIGSKGQIEPLAQFIDNFSRKNTSIPMIIDPAIGDNGRLYVSVEIARGIATHLLPCAKIITPNQFELGWLTETAVTSRDQAFAAAQNLLARHPLLQAVIITGLIESDQISDALITEEDSMFFEKSGAGQGFPGGGDLFTAIFTANLVNGLDLVKATEQACFTCHAILEESRKRNSDEILLTAITDHLR
jgi:pyridoxine kinase